MKTKDSLIGKPHFFFDSIESTNDIANTLADFDYPEGTAVSARTQTKGRGRLGRTWLSPQGDNVLLSVLLRPKAQNTDILLLSLVGALGVARAIKQFYKGEVHVKWPNDIFIHGKKIAGILSELKVKGNKPSHLIMGIGLNLNSNLNNFDTSLKNRATSLSIERGQKVDKEEFLIKLFKNLSNSYEDWSGAKHETLVKNINSMLYKRGEIINFNDGKKTVSGKLIKINNNGSIRLKLKNLDKDYFSGEIIID